MSRPRFIKKILRETLVGFLVAGVTSSTLFTNLLLPVPSAHAAAMCYPPGEGPDLKSVAAPAKSGGVKLDQAATFLAGVSELTGAYYDAARDQIVFIGREETSVPKFDKDDLAVAIKTIFFAEANPGVKIEYPAPEQFERGHRRYIDPQYMHVNYMPSKYGDQPNYDTWANENEQRVANTPYGIEDTALAKVLFEADLKLKHYFLGFVKGVGPEGEHGREERVGSSVSGYRPHYQRWAQKNPDLSKSRGAVRVWMSPQEILVDRDDATASFVFKKVTMAVTVRDVLLQNESNEDPKWREAAEEFAAHHTQNFAAFAAETPAYGQVERLAQIVGVVKWLKDNQIATDFQWARHYEPSFVETPTTTNMLLVEIEDNGRGPVATNEDHAGHEHLLIGGGQHFFEPLTYATNASSEASGIKQAALAAQPQQADFHWDFTKDGRLYEAIAVSAQLFRDTGAYDTAVTDLALNTVGDIPLALTRRYLTQASERAYSSHTSLGRGWDALPARLTDLTPASPGPDCAASGGQPYRLAFETQTGQYDTFTYQCGSGAYQPDSALTTTRLTVNPDGIYTATAKSLATYTFDFFREYGKAHRLREIADRNGNAIHYDYHESSANLAKIYDDGGHWIGLEYEGGRVVKAADHTGRRVSYTYDAGSRLIKTTDVLGRATQYEYDNQNRLAAIIDPAGQRALTLTYNELNKVTSQTDALGQEVALAYDETSRTVTASDSDGLTNKQTYDDQARLVEAIDALGQAVKYAYGASLSPETVTDKLGHVTRYQYDSRGNVTKITSPDGATLDAAYTPADLPAQITDGRYIPGRATNLTYDAKNNLTKQDTAGVARQNAYDQSGQVSQATDPLGQTTTYQRNNLGLPTAVTDPLGNVTSYEYDALGRLTKQTDPSGAVTNFTYDAAGKLLSVADASGATRYDYDSLNRLTKLTQPDGTTAQYTYNPANQITKVTDAKGNSTTYKYDTKGNLITRQTPAGSEYKTEFDALSRPVRQVTPLGQVSQAAYDAEGNLINSTDAKSQVTSQVFDALGRPTQLTFADQTQIKRTYDSRGNLLSATDPTGEVSLTYDQFDRLTKSTDPFGNAVQYAYDGSGRRISLTYPSGQTVHYNYDGNDQLTEVKDWNNQSTSLAYYPNGLLKEKKLANGLTAQYDYDLANRLSRLAYLTAAGQVLGETDIERSLVGNITKLAESGPLFTQPIGAGPSPTPTPAPSSSPTPTPSPSPSPTPVSTKPDLVVTDVKISVPNPAVNQRFTITATVKNQGGTDTGASFRTAFYYDRETAPAPTDSYGDYGTVFRLKPGESDEADDKFVKYSTSGQHKIWVYVDQGLKISESNEGNNVFGPFIVTVNPQTTAFFGLIPTAQAQAAQQLITTFAYDALGQLTKIVYPNNQTYDYSYDAIGNRTGNTYDADAKLLFTPSRVEGQGTTFTYDANGALATKQDASKTTGYSFNARGELVRAGEGEAPNESWVLAFTKQADKAWGIDVGRDSSPALADIDADGDLDLFIGNSNGTISFYQNDGIPESTSYQLLTTNYSNIDIGANSAPEFADIDGDGDLDLFIGKRDGTISFYQNDGSSESTSYQLLTTNYSNIDIGDYAVPRLADIDNDGDLDLFIGTKNGTIAFYQNTGTREAPNYQLQTTSYSNIDIGSNSAPLFVNLDHDSDLDLLVGKSDGTISFYQNTGTPESTSYQLLATNYSNIDVGSDSVPLANDLTGDALPDLLVGDSTGVLDLYAASKSITTPPDLAPKFTYDALGNRLQQTVKGTQTRYVNDVSGELPYVLAELNASNQPQSLNLHAGGLASFGPAASTARLYPLTDPLGNIRFITDSAGNLLARYSYDPYGNIRSKEGTVVSAFTFAGEQSDSETGLTFLRARYYDPNTGVFLSRDPVLGPLNLPHSQHPYAYALNNPVNLNDPSGEIAPAVIAAAIAYLAALGSSPDLGFDLNLLALDVAQGDYLSACADAIAAAVPFLPAGLIKAGKGIPSKAFDMLQQVKKSGWKAPEGYYPSKVYKNISEPSLPGGGNYREFDVNPFVSKAQRKLERIVVNINSGKAWYTPEHYKKWIPFQ